MNDRHPSGTMTTPAPASDASSAHYGHAPYGTHEASYGDFTTYGGYDVTGFAHSHDTTGTFHADPLFGSMPGRQATGAYDTTQWQTSPTPHYDAYAAQHHAAYDSGVHDATAWTVPPQATSHDAGGQWDTSGWLQPEQPGGMTQQWEWGTQSFETGAYDATPWNSPGQAGPEQAGEPFDQQPTATFEQVDDLTAAFPQTEYVADDPVGTGTDERPAVNGLLEDQEETPPTTRAGARNAARSRRRTPAKRSALLTVAVPSACVMGVAGIAVASVGAFSDDGKDTAATAADAHAVKPAIANSKLDAQLKTLSADAHDFADRASRTQERIDLKNQQEQDRKKALAEAALKERLRPKFVLPVTQKGLSAYFGQAGVNWMSVHTGIDFPVSYGTTVMAATDGTVTTKWNSAYGNMLILTAKDGTETWYCHLSSYQVPAGTSVKAGQPIAYSGNSGNSTGPHLHFEVHPAGGAAVDPLPWLRSHDLDPT